MADSPDPNRYGAVNEVIHHPDTQAPALYPGQTAPVGIWDPYSQYILPSELELRLAQFAATLPAVSIDTELIYDTIAASLASTGSVTLVLDDTNNRVTIGSAATANSTDAELRTRSTHSGSQPSTTISDFTEASQDAIASFLVAGANITLTHNDASNTMTISSTGGGTAFDAEAARDAVAAALVGAGLVTITVNDAADTITITTTATANDTDANLKNRANHTGTQLSSTISDFTEAAQDAVAAMLVSGANVTLTYNDVSNTLQVTATGGDAETMRDTIGAAIIGTSGVTVTVNDAADTITLAVSSITIAQVTNLQTNLDAKLLKASNLSDLPDKAASRVSLGLSNAVLAKNASGTLLTDVVLVLSATDPGVLPTNSIWVQPGDTMPQTLAVTTNDTLNRTAPLNTPAEVDATLRQALTVPASGKLMVRLQAFVNSTAAATYIWIIQVMVSGVETRADYVFVRDTAGKGWSNLDHYLDGLTPGNAIEIRWEHFATVASNTVIETSTSLGKQALMEVIVG